MGWDQGVGAFNRLDSQFADIETTAVLLKIGKPSLSRTVVQITFCDMHCMIQTLNTRSAEHADTRYFQNAFSWNPPYLILIPEPLVPDQLR